ncbi:MAG: DUF3990 domain-containing protein [Thermoguttaceae bacterium]
MILYHGGMHEVQTPQIRVPNRPLDFSVGFYTTTQKSQAEKWAKSKQEKSKKQGRYANAVVSVYECSPDIFDDNFAVKVFTQADDEWLDFIVKNRKTVYLTHPFDIVKGPVANDTLFRTINLFEEGVYTKEETILRLKSHLLFDQISFHTELALQRLAFVESGSISQ